MPVIAAHLRIERMKPLPIPFSAILLGISEND